MALASPPASHMVRSACRASRSRIACTSVVVSRVPLGRVPLAPSGCPGAVAAPCTSGDRRLRTDGDRPMVPEHSGDRALAPAVTRRACGDEVRREDLAARPQAPGRTVTGPTAA